MSHLRTGIPRLEEIDRHLQIDLYRRMVACDDEFVRIHRKALRRYVLRWGGQPMRLFSRRWEYPFAADRVLGLSAPAGSTLRILDAGSGVTFFPYFICDERPEAHFVCCDSNARYGRVFEAVNRRRGDERVVFAPARLQELPLEDASQDAVCCISVLEHTNQYERILDEFRRVLRPGGLLVLTFDISLDGRTQIPREQAVDLLEAVEERFVRDDETGLLPELDRLAKPEDILTTDYVRRTEPGLLPWRWPRLKSLYDFLHGRGFSGGFFSLTCYCLDARAPAARGAKS